MKKIIKGYVFRLYPNTDQINLIEKVLVALDIFIITF